MNVLAATLLCDRKAASQLFALPAVCQLEGVTKYYINIETSLVGYSDPELWRPLRSCLAETSMPHHVERWYRDGWKGYHATYDQDQARLYGIVTARNMAIDYAMASNADWLLFIDADVIPRPDGLRKLLALNKPLCGGLVKGRGAHEGARYVFHEEWERNGIIKCGFGTCGYMLINRQIFRRLRFRFGEHMQKGVILSEDPAYCSDARIFGLSDGFYIDTSVIAEHKDDPDYPLTLKEACKWSIP